MPAETDELKQMLDTAIIENEGSAYEIDIYESRAMMQPGSLSATARFPVLRND